ncbi:MAG: hypothetical protein RLZZ230_466 [Candidatus Parcubacteria bacterium]|jgi:hypothetical protein
MFLNKIFNSINLIRKPKKIDSVVFISKHKHWAEFGSNKEEFEKWVSETCGIYCLKMLGDTLNLTNKITIFELTMQVFKAGGFKIEKDGTITGVFHKPLMQIVKSFGIKGRVIRKLNHTLIKKYLFQGKIVILSIDLHKVNKTLSGGHLILIHKYDESLNDYILHDCANVLNNEGSNISVSTEYIESISNSKGLVWWN